MHQGLVLTLGAVLLVGASALVTTRVVKAQDHGQGQPPAGMDPAMTARMMELAARGPWKPGLESPPRKA